MAMISFAPRAARISEQRFISEPSLLSHRMRRNKSTAFCVHGLQPKPTWFDGGATEET
jgi:hypothetical protein